MLRREVPRVTTLVSRGRVSVVREEPARRVQCAVSANSRSLAAPVGYHTMGKPLDRLRQQHRLQTATVVSSPSGDVAVSPVLVQMWQGEPSPGADVAG